MTDEEKARIEVENFLRILLLISFLVSCWSILYQIRPNHRQAANQEIIELLRERKTKPTVTPEAPQDNLIADMP